MNFQGKSHATPEILSDAATENNTCVASLNTVDLLCFCSHSRHTLVKLQAFILVQKECVILFVTLLSYQGTKVLTLVTAAHWSVLFYQNHTVVSCLEERSIQKLR